MSANETDKASTSAEVSYDESKRMVSDSDPAVRLELARQRGLRPEVLYYLAEDSSLEVRRLTAANPDCPPQADLLLAQDDAVDVRSTLAAKVARLRPEFDPDASARATRFIVETLETLARDQAIQVRSALAEGLKTLPNAPRGVIMTLARDIEDDIACRVLEASPVIGDDDLLEIIDYGCDTGRLKAISRRPGLGEAISDAIIARDDHAAITSLLSNQSAQIREDALDRLIDAAVDQPDWHRPLVCRPLLGKLGILRLAEIAADTFLQHLLARPDIDEETAHGVAEIARRRLEEAQTEAEPEETGEEKARRLFGEGALDADLLFEALDAGDHDLVRLGLTLLSGRPREFVDKVLAARSPKAIAALVWAAGCPMRLAIQIQIKIARIPPGAVLYAHGGVDFPLTEAEMDWQLQFFSESED